MTGNTDKVTIAGWMKIRDITPGQFSFPFGFENADASASNWALIGISDLNVQEFSCLSLSPDWSTPPSQDTWYYFYIIGENDGVSAVNWQAGYYTAAGSSPVDTVTALNQAEFNIVRISIGNNSWDEWLDSVFAHVRVWTGVALTDSELRAERDSTTAVKTSGLWADWPLADNTDTGDDSGNGRTLTFGGTLTTETGPLATSTVPDAPTGLVAKGGDAAQSKAGAYLQWETPSNGGATITGYKIQKNVNSGGWTDVTGGNSQNPNLEYTHATDIEQWTFIDMSSHSNGASVQFRVAATNSEGDSAWSTASTAVNLTKRLYPNSVSGRRILDQDGNSYTVIGDTPWSLVAQTRENIREYMDALVTAGANSIIVSIPEPWYGPSATTDSDGLHQYNAYGDLPWSGGAAFQLNSGGTTLNSSYWIMADYLIRYAAALGVTCWIFPAYMGYGTDGYANNTGNDLTAATNADMTAYGQALNTRYASDKNILWAPGHDTTPDTTETQRMEYLFGVNGQTATFTNHMIFPGGPNNYPSQAHAWIDFGNFVVGDFDINSVYSYDSDTSPVADIIESAIDDTPAHTGPFNWMEGVYENSVVETETQIRLRGQLWGSVAQGAAGHFGGHCERWHLGSPNGPTGNAWETSWTENGTVMFLDTFANIIANLSLSDFHLLLGDFDTQQLITNDGTGRSSARYLANTGALIYVYNTTTLVLDLTVLGSGNVAIYRIDPESGSRSTLQTSLSTVGQTAYTGLQGQGNNSDSAADWLFELVFTASSEKLPARVMKPIQSFRPIRQLRI